MSFCLEASANGTSPDRPRRPAADRERGNTTLLCAVEPLDLAGAVHLRERAQPLLSNTRCLVVDLLGAPFIDSSGVRMLMALAEELEGRGGELWLVVRPDSPVQRTLRLLHLHRRFRIFHTLEDAWTGKPAGQAD